MDNKMNRAKKLLESFYQVNELLTDNLKLTDKEESEIDNFTKELRAKGLSVISNKDLKVIFGMLNSNKNLSDDTRFKYAYKLTSGFTMVSRGQFEKEFPWVIREVKKGTKDVFLYPNQVGGYSSFKYVGKDGNKYNFKYFGSPDYNFMGDLSLTKDEVEKNIKDSYLKMPIRVID